MTTVNTLTHPPSGPEHGVTAMYRRVTVRVTTVATKTAWVTAVGRRKGDITDNCHSDTE